MYGARYLFCLDRLSLLAERSDRGETAGAGESKFGNGGHRTVGQRHGTAGQNVGRRSWE